MVRASVGAGGEALAGPRLAQLGLTFPSELNQLESIGHFFLYKASSLETLTLPSELNQLKSIGKRFLCNASSLKTLTFPSKLNQLKSIEDDFLYGASSLKIIKCPKNALSLIKKALSKRMLKQVNFVLLDK